MLERCKSICTHGGWTKSGYCIWRNVVRHCQCWPGGTRHQTRGGVQAGQVGGDGEGGHQGAEPRGPPHHGLPWPGHPGLDPGHGPGEEEHRGHELCGPGLGQPGLPHRHAGQVTLWIRSGQRETSDLTIKLSSSGHGPCLLKSLKFNSCESKEVPLTK